MSFCQDKQKFILELGKKGGVEMQKINEYTITSFISKEGLIQLSNRRVLFHIKERMNIYDTISREIVSVLPPVSVALCPTPECVRFCIFCSNTVRNKEHRQAKAVYSDKLFERIVVDLDEMNVQGVTIAGGGEPMTYQGQALWKLFLTQHSFQIGLHTNGITITKDRFKDLASAPYLRYVNLSFIAHKPELYTKIARRSANQFNVIERFLLDYPKMLNSLNSPQEFSVKVLICRENYGYVNEIVNYLQGCNITNILLRCVANFERQQDVELTRAQKKELGYILREMKIPSEQVETVLGRHHAKIPVPSRCWINTLMYTAGIDPDGEVYLCSQYSFIEYSIGNVNEIDFKRIWESKKHLEVIDRLNQRCVSGKCDILTCRHYYSNLAIDSFISGFFKALPKDKLEENYGRFI